MLLSQNDCWLMLTARAHVVILWESWHAHACALVSQLSKCPHQTSFEPGTTECRGRGADWKQTELPHMGVYDIRGTFLGSLLQGDPTIWGSVFLFSSTPKTADCVELPCHTRSSPSTLCSGSSPQPPDPVTSWLGLPGTMMSR